MLIWCRLNWLRSSVGCDYTKFLALRILSTRFDQELEGSSPFAALMPCLLFALNSTRNTRLTFQNGCGARVSKSGMIILVGVRAHVALWLNDGTFTLGK
jgi:hypothetical protein